MRLLTRALPCNKKRMPHLLFAHHQLLLKLDDFILVPRFYQEEQWWNVLYMVRNSGKLSRKLLIMLMPPE